MPSLRGEGEGHEGVTMTSVGVVTYLHITIMGAGLLCKECIFEQKVRKSSSFSGRSPSGQVV